MKRKRKRKRKISRRRWLVYFCLTISFVVLLLYWLITLFGDPVYYNYDIHLPSPLASLPTSPYQFSYLDTTAPYYRYEDDHYESVVGIDVSSHNKEIDWQQVYDSGIRFAYLRVGFRGYGAAGLLKKDEKFEEYYRQAKKVGLAIGVYFFSQAISHEEAMEEAFFTLENIRHKEIDLPIAYDLEDIDYDHSRLMSSSFEKRSENAMIFAQKIEENGYACSIYANKYWLEKVYNPYLILQKEIWYAQYHDTPTISYPFSIWQYSDKGKVPGISVDTDLNLWFIPKGKRPSFLK